MRGFAGLYHSVCSVIALLGMHALYIALCAKIDADQPRHGPPTIRAWFAGLHPVTCSVRLSCVVAGFTLLCKIAKCAIDLWVVM